MASHTAVAEAPPQADLEQLLPAAIQRFTLFGTSQEREIPKHFMGLPRRGGAFAKWYNAQWRLIRYALAAAGNIAARESLKKQAASKRAWKQLPANKAYKNERARLAHGPPRELCARCSKVRFSRFSLIACCAGTARLRG